MGAVKMKDVNFLGQPCIGAGPSYRRGMGPRPMGQGLGLQHRRRASGPRYQRRHDYGRDMTDMAKLGVTAMLGTAMIGATAGAVKAAFP